MHGVHICDVVIFTTVVARRKNTGSFANLLNLRDCDLLLIVTSLG